MLINRSFIHLNAVSTYMLYLPAIFQYSAVQLGTTGSGGEYAPQKGFGWTNGFIMELLNTWGKYLQSE